MARECIFCGAAKVTKEHVIPKWLPKHIGQDHLVIPESPGRGVRSPLIKFGDFKAGVLCLDCNRWGGRAEDEAKPILVDLLAGRRRYFSAPERLVLAKWCAKTAFCVLAAYGFAPREGSRYLRNNGVPDDLTRVCIGHMKPKPAPIFDICSGRVRGRRYRDVPMRDLGRMRFVSMVFDHLAVQVLVAGELGGDGLFPMAYPREYYACLWPSYEQNILPFPPPKSFVHPDQAMALNLPPERLIPAPGIATMNQSIVSAEEQADRVGVGRRAGLRRPARRPAGGRAGPARSPNDADDPLRAH